MTRAEKKVIQARVAVRVFALQAARDAVKASIRAHGLKLYSFSARDISLWAEVGSRSILTFSQRLEPKQ